MKRNSKRIYPKTGCNRLQNGPADCIACCGSGLNPPLSPPRPLLPHEVCAWVLWQRLPAVYLTPAPSAPDEPEAKP